MKSVLPVKMLAALALVLLAFSATEGRIVSKCELKAQLEAALARNVTGNVTDGLVNGTAPGNTTVDSNLIAKIVCSVERLSKFNTNLVNTIQGDRPEVRPPPRPAQGSGGRPGGRPDGRPDGRPGGRPDGRPGGRPGGRGKRSPGGGRGRNPPSLFGDSSEEDSSSEEVTRATTRLLGLFQLSDRVVCNPGNGQSLNICQMDCSALIDDNISDDIACLKTLLDTVTNVIAPAVAPRHKKDHLLAVRDCLNVNPAQYFAECV